MTPDRAEAERFLTGLDPNASGWTFQTFDDNKERREQTKKNRGFDPFAKILHGTLAEHWNALAKLNAHGAGIYVTVNVTNFKGRLAEDIVSVRALFADLDGSPLDPVIAPGAIQPHIVAESSSGRWHAYWRIAEGMPRALFEPMQKAIAARYDGDGVVFDLPRVMRLPGFIHCKGEPFLSRIERINDIKSNGHGAVSEPYRHCALVAAFQPVLDEPSPTASGQSKRKASRWGELNERALKAESLPRWVPKIFPSAKRTRAGGFRVASADLGRGFEEDLGIDPRGIKYFGIADQGDPRCGRRTAVELVAEFQQVEAPQAADWLEQTLNSGGNGQDGGQQAPPPPPPPPPPEPEPQPEAATAAEVEVTRLAQLSRDKYEDVRKDVAKALRWRVNVLDDFVRAERVRLGLAGGDDGKDPAPALYEHWNVEMADEPIDGGILLRAIKEAIRRYVFATDDHALAAALWIVFSWLHEYFTHSPIFFVTSAERDSGKTTLLGVINFLARRSLLNVDSSGAALFRAITKWQPTLIVDEADDTLADNADLRSVINSGWTRGQGALRCHPDTHEPEMFSTFAPKVVAMKGRNLPDTTLSRCIIVTMRPRRPDDPEEHAADFDHLDNETFQRLRSQTMRWASDNSETIAKATPEIPPGFFNRRRANWKPLLAIAEACGGDWKKDAWKAALAIEAVADTFDPSIGVELLRAIKAAFKSNMDRITSADLIKDLVDDQTAPWATYTKGKPITQRQVATLLKPYGIKPKTIKLKDGSTPRGYLLEMFEDAFNRFCSTPSGPNPPILSVTSVTDLFSQDFSRFRSVTGGGEVTDRKDEKPFDINEVTEVTDEKGGPGQKGTICAHCGLPGGNEVSIGGGPMVRLHRQCEDAYQGLQDDGQGLEGSPVASSPSRGAPRFRIIPGSVQPDAVCVFCLHDNGEEVLRIVGPEAGSKSETLHEGCAAAWFDGLRNFELPDDNDDPWQGRA